MVGHVALDLAAALDSGKPLVFAMLRVDLPGFVPPLCLLSGAGEVDVLGQKFLGRDERVGALSEFDPPQDGSADGAPNMSFDIATISDAAAITLSSATYQGSRVRLWVSCVINDVGAIATPYLLFDGILDKPRLALDKKSRELTIDCVSGFELLFADTEGQRLADASHKAIWPDENGFQWVTGANRSIIWGPGERPGNSLSYGGAAGGAFSSGGSSRSFLNRVNENYE